MPQRQGDGLRRGDLLQLGRKPVRGEERFLLPLVFGDGAALCLAYGLLRPVYLDGGQGASVHREVEHVVRGGARQCPVRIDIGRCPGLYAYRGPGHSPKAEVVVRRVVRRRPASRADACDAEPDGHRGVEGFLLRAGTSGQERRRGTNE